MSASGVAIVLLMEGQRSSCRLGPQRKASRTATLMIAQVKSFPKVENIELVKEYVTEPANVNYLHVGGKKKLKASYDTDVTELLVRSCPRAVSKSQLMLQAKMEGFRIIRRLSIARAFQHSSVEQSVQ